MKLTALASALLGLFITCSGANATEIEDNYAAGMKGKLDKAAISCAKTIGQLDDISTGSMTQADLSLSQAVGICKKATASGKAEDWERLGDLYWNILGLFPYEGEKYIKAMAQAYEKSQALGGRKAKAYFRASLAGSIKNGKLQSHQPGWLFTRSNVDGKELDKRLQKGISEGMKELWAGYTFPDIINTPALGINDAFFTDLNRALENRAVDDLSGSGNVDALARFLLGMGMISALDKDLQAKVKAVTNRTPLYNFAASVFLSDPAASVAYFCDALEGGLDKKILSSPAYNAQVRMQLNKAADLKDEALFTRLLSDIAQYGASPYLMLDFSRSNEKEWAEKTAAKVLPSAFGKNGNAEAMAASLMHKDDKKNSEREELSVKSALLGHPAFLSQVITRRPADSVEVKKAREVAAGLQGKDKILFSFIQTENVQDLEGKKRAYLEMADVLPVDLEMRLEALIKMMSAKDGTSEYRAWVQDQMEKAWKEGKNKPGHSYNMLRKIAGCYISGEGSCSGFSLDAKESVKWGKRAIASLDRNDDVGGVFAGLGDIYANGVLGYPQNVKAAVDVYKVAALGKSFSPLIRLEAISSLSDLLSKYEELKRFANIAESLKEDREVAGNSLEHLANIRFRTAYAAYEERKYSDAFKWYSRDLDNPKAYASTFNNVAIYYDEGIAVKKNKNKATELLVKAYCKRTDYAFGSRRLAERYDSGIGTPKNIVYAYYLYNKAGEDKYLKRRDALRELMTMKELEKAQTDLTSEICK